jgi:hypothetical protein
MFRKITKMFRKIFHRSPSLGVESYRDLLFKPIQEIPYLDVSELWMQLGALNLSWSLQVLPNEKRALTLLDLGIQCFEKAGPRYQEEALELLMIYFKSIKSIHIEFGKKALREIEDEHPDWALRLLRVI